MYEVVDGVGFWVPGVGARSLLASAGLWGHVNCIS